MFQGHLRAKVVLLQAAASAVEARSPSLTDLRANENHLSICFEVNHQHDISKEMLVHCSRLVFGLQATTTNHATSKDHPNSRLV